MKKKFIISLLLFTMILSPIYSTVFSDYSSIKEVKTEHFDIIYRMDSLNTANLIYANAEHIYEEILNEYNLKRSQRFPVVITKDVEDLNAFFTAFYRPRIVMYDTVSTNDSLNVFPNEQLLTIFKHELTHALTMTNEPNFINSIFGEAFSYYTLNITPFLAEGIAVNNESLNGFGRLNDPLNNAKLIQAKNDGSFPNYLDVQGNRDIRPGLSASYLYGAGFLNYIKTTYGKEKFNEYWDKLGKPSFFFAVADVLFEEVYNISLDQAWNDFKNSIVKIDFADNLDLNTFKTYQPSQITRDKDNIYFMDKGVEGIYKIENNKIEPVKKGVANINSFYVNDGVLTLSAIKYTPLETCYTIIIKDNKIEKLNIPSFRNSIYLENKLVGLQNDGTIESIAEYDLQENLLNNSYLEKNEQLQNIAVLNNRIIFTSRLGENNCISIMNSDYSRNVFVLPKYTSIQGLSTYKDKIVFSYVEKDNLAKLAILDYKNNEMQILDQNINGGVYYPTLKDDNQAIYQSLFFDNLKLNELNFDKNKFRTVHLKSFILPQKTTVEENVSITKSINYNPLTHLNHGTLLPYIYPHIFAYKGFGTGALYYTNDPTELINLVYATSLDFNFDENATTLSNKLVLSQNYNNYANKISMNMINTTVDFQKLFNQFYSTIYNSLYFNLGTNDGLFINSNIDFNFPNNYDGLNPAITSSDLYINRIINIIEGGYRFKVKMGANRENYFKLQLSSSLITYFNIVKSGLTITNTNVNSIYIHLPYLIPNLNNQFFVYNFPTSFTFNLINYIASNLQTGISLDINTLLFSMDIQKGTPFIPMFLRRFNVDLTTNIVKSGIKAIEMKAYFDTGIAYSMSNAFNMRLGASVSYDFNDKDYFGSFYFDIT